MSKEAERIERLERRYKFLIERVEHYKEELSYDLAEASALRWIIDEYKRLTKGER